MAVMSHWPTQQEQQQVGWYGSDDGKTSYLSPVRSSLNDRRSVDEVSSLSSGSQSDDAPNPVEIPYGRGDPSGRDGPQWYPTSRPHEPVIESHALTRSEGEEESRVPVPTPAVSRPGHQWRPSYLRRRVLLAAAVLCAVLIVAVEVLVGYSSSHQGLAISYSYCTYIPESFTNHFGIHVTAPERCFASRVGTSPDIRPRSLSQEKVTDLPLLKCTTCGRTAQRFF